MVAQVLLTGQPFGVAGALGQDTDPLPDVHGARAGDARYGERSPRRREDRREHADRARLSGAVLTEHAEDLTSLDGECQIFDRDETAVFLAYASRFDCRAHPLITSAQAKTSR